MNTMTKTQTLTLYPAYTPTHNLSPTGS